METTCLLRSVKDMIGLLRLHLISSQNQRNLMVNKNQCLLRSKQRNMTWPRSATQAEDGEACQGQG